METNIILLLQLLLAHVLTDFVLQTNKMVKHKQKHKEKSWYLYFHSFLAGLLTYIFLQQWASFLVPLVIMITHFFIDLWKLHQKKDNLKFFLIDQLAHLIIILLAFVYLTNTFSGVFPAIAEFFSSPKQLAILIGYVIVIFPVGFIIGKATERWQEEIEVEEKKKNSLKKAGRYIGIFERILILTFILSSNFSAIGFLIGAKSILRFGDSQGARKQTEYILVGTLMSFALCIIVGVLIRHFVFE